MTMMEKDAKIYVAGHRGMVGSAIVRELERQGYTRDYDAELIGYESDSYWRADGKLAPYSRKSS